MVKRQKFSLTKDVLHHHSLVYCTTWSRALERWAAAELRDKAALVSLPVPVSWDFGSNMALDVFRAHVCLVPSCAAAPSPLYWPGLPVSSRLKSSSYSEFTIKIGPCQHVGISFGFKFRCYLEMAHTWFDVLIIIWEINSLIEKILCLEQKLLKGPCYSPTNENRNRQDFWFVPSEIRVVELV